jgi:hypothetical protein
MTSGLYIWKYEAGNYFEGINYIDKIAFSTLPADAFPVFDMNTEEIFGIAQYKAGEFDINISIDTGERSAKGKSAYEFFRSGSNNKFVIILKLGEVNSKKFCGTSTNEFISFSFNTRFITIKCTPMIDELAAQVSKSYIGPIESSITFDEYLAKKVLPGGIRNCAVSKSFQSYGTLIGDQSVLVRKELQESGAWINSVDMWQIFQELMTGTGLNWKVVQSPEPIPLFSTNYPGFLLYIFSLSGLSGTTRITKVLEASDTSLFRKAEWLYIGYRYWDRDFTPRDNGDYAISFQDGIITNGNGLPKWADKKRYIFQGVPLPYPPWFFPAFVTTTNGYYNFNTHQIINFNSESLKFLISNNSFDGEWKIDKDYKKIDLPVYRYEYEFEGSIPPMTRNKYIAYSRILNASSWNFQPVQNFTINQYKRYVGGYAKKNKNLFVQFDPIKQFELWQKIILTENGEDIEYYIMRIENLNLKNKTCELTLIEL